MTGEGGAGAPNDARGTEFNRVLVTLLEDARRRSFVQMFNAWTPRVAVEGDHESAVDPDTIKELVALAKADNRADFDFLAGAAGVHAHRREDLWTGTRARLNKPPDDPEAAPREGVHIHGGAPRETFYGRSLSELIAEAGPGEAIYLMPDGRAEIVHVQGRHSWWWAPDGRMFWTDNTAPPQHWTARIAADLRRENDESPAIRNGLRRPHGYRERPRWQDRRTGRERPWA